MADANIMTFGQPFSPTNDVVADNSSNALTIESLDGSDYIVADTTNDSEALVLMGSGVGEVGINNSSPDAMLSITGNLTTALSGTFTATNGDTAISSGSSTAFLSELYVGAAIKIGSEGTYGVAAIASDTALTLDSNFTGTTGSGKSGTTDPDLVHIKDGDGDTAFKVVDKARIVAGNADKDNLAIGSSNQLQKSALTTGSANIVVGHQNATSVTSGGTNVIVGTYSGDSITTGSSNTLMGQNVCTSGNHSNATAVGHNASRFSTSNNIATYGYQAAWKVNAINTVAMGYRAGYDASTTSSGAGNTFLGANTTLGTAASDANCTVLGEGAVGQGSNTIMLGNSSIDSTNGLYCYDTGIASPSDERVKENIQECELGLEFIEKLTPVSYQKKHPSEYPEEIREARWSDREDDAGEVIPADVKPDDWEAKTEVGLIAQEVKAVMDEMGVEFHGHNVNPQGMEHLKYVALVVPLVKAVQELSARVKELEDGGA